MVGGATRLARFVAAGTKVYHATARLGQATDTDDLTGAPLGRGFEGQWPTHEEVVRAGRTLVGRIEQRPPAFSAKLVEGERSYRRARRGEAVDLEPVEVEVEAVDVTCYDPPILEFEATVGPGTFVRALARDWGERLGTAAHLVALRRTTVGRFSVADATPLDRVGPATPLLPAADLVDLPRVTVTGEEARLARQGRRVGSAAAGEPTSALLLGDELVAVGEPRDGQWQPIVVLGVEG